MTRQCHIHFAGAGAPAHRDGEGYVCGIGAPHLALIFQSKLNTPWGIASDPWDAVRPSLACYRVIYGGHSRRDDVFHHAHYESTPALGPRPAAAPRVRFFVRQLRSRPGRHFDKTGLPVV